MTWAILMPDLSQSVSKPASGVPAGSAIAFSMQGPQGIVFLE
jgi:hypothetical protein